MIYSANLTSRVATVCISLRKAAIVLSACLSVGTAYKSLGQDGSSAQALQTPAVVHSGPLTEEQGEDILNELRLIRKALEDRQRAQPVTPSGGGAFQRARISEDTGWFILGDKKAPITLIEFSDFQCPFCRQFDKATLPEIKRKYIDSGQVRFVSLEFPLVAHPDALNAALAARCAGAQDRYWQMRSAMLEGEHNLSLGELAWQAEELTLNMDKFKSCMKDEAVAASVRRDIADGQKIGVVGTPAFLIGSSQNGVIEGARIDGAQPYSAFAAVIERELAKQSESTRQSSR